MLMTATQEDIDFLIAFADKDDSSLVHLVMLEAKGVTGWSNSQLARKARRLNAIFGNDGTAWGNQGGESKAFVRDYLPLVAQKH